ncbi:MAG: hypothetical protein ABIN23_03285 [candidate division WOR-3 bacterium]|nr:hypothetical protein [Candidatus Omnitrophota bacterium]
MKKIKTPSLINIMSEKEINEEFLPQLENATKNLFKILYQLNSSLTLPPRELSFALMKEADEVESFLDEFGANQNRKFFFFRELVATIRWFNFYLFQGLHLYARLKHYKLQIHTKEFKQFKTELKNHLMFAYKVIKKISNKIFEEGKNLGLKSIKKSTTPEKLFPQLQRKILPPDLVIEKTEEKEETIFKILIKYLNVCEEFNLFYCRKREFLKEEPVEKYRSLFHQLESLYDTYVKNTNYEIEIPDFQKIRGHIAVSWHLLEMAKSIAHFYERHIEKLQNSDIYYKIMDCIGDEKKLFEITEKFLFSFVLKFSMKGKEICETIFNKMGKKPEEFLIETKILTIPSYRIEDFHIRPIMPVTQIANQYSLDLFLYFKRKKYNLKSPIEMAIAIPDIREDLSKENVQIIIQGPRAGVLKIVEFFKEKVGAFEQELKCEILMS